MRADVASGDIARNYLLKPLSQAAATQLYRKDTLLEEGMHYRGFVFHKGPHDEISSQLHDLVRAIQEESVR